MLREDDKRWERSNITKCKSGLSGEIRGSAQGHLMSDSGTLRTLLASANQAQGRLVAQTLPRGVSGTAP